jgi:hypothetical protein
MPRFVLLRHECPPQMGKPSHWDLMLERGGALWTWSLLRLPAAWRAAGTAAGDGGERSVAATRLADHRRRYLTYEGPLSENRGDVSRVDQGAFEFISDDEGALVLDLSGRTLRGRITLTRREGDQWQLALPR